MNWLLFTAAFATVMTIAQGASATVISWTFGTEFSGSGGTLSGDVLVTVDDSVGPDSVLITIDTTDLDGSLSEYISGLYLNLNPALDPTDLVGVAGVADPDPMFAFGTDAFQADGDGLYDILISYPSAACCRFEADMIDTFTLSLEGLDALDFGFLSTPAGGHGPFEAALRARSLGADENDSGWFFPERTPDEDVPEPATLMLIGLGLFSAGLAGRHRRR